MTQAREVINILSEASRSKLRLTHEEEVVLAFLRKGIERSGKDEDWIIVPAIGKLVPAIDRLVGKELVEQHPNRPQSLRFTPRGRIVSANLGSIDKLMRDLGGLTIGDYLEIV